jgi:hypothetical protein
VLFKLVIRSQIHVYNTYVSIENISLHITVHRMIIEVINYTKLVNSANLKTILSILLPRDPAFNNTKTNFILRPSKQVIEISNFKCQETIHAIKLKYSICPYYKTIKYDIKNDKIS